MEPSLLDALPALVVIDLQKGIVDGPKAHPVEGVVANAVALAESFRSLGLPVVLVNVAGGAPGRTDFDYGDDDEDDDGAGQDWVELLPELDPRPSDLRVTKTNWGAFTNSTLHAQLQERGVTQVVLTGINTQIGVETTARTAYELGYNVVLVTDAMTSFDATAHEHSVTRIFPRLGQNTTTADLLTLLAARSA
ncbi:cysteine hydrolase [Kitasatospora aureofaciens]|uniref:isochorismatase family cysteine hydrolase n=1 Tax=Kitasatospora aureofaciens TaxID=1894 RepID=UPI001C437B35|nr:isochorismatase family cysteine hydrolase [Kitasatospora aureofaciens]MBV6702499.1 cysteine hydrolase [Kitasatospora aureofaciens]